MRPQTTTLPADGNSCATIIIQSRIYTTTSRLHPSASHTTHSIHSHGIEPSSHHPSIEYLVRIAFPTYRRCLSVACATLRAKKQTHRFTTTTMFSPNQNTPSGPAMSTRSRRRQRPASADNSLTQQPKAKRQRRPLTESNLVNPDPHNAQPEMLEVKHDKVARLPSVPDGIENAQTTTTRPLRREVTVRSKKPKQGERTIKSDGSVELVRGPHHNTSSSSRAFDSRVSLTSNPFTDQNQRIYREQAASTAG